MCIKSKSRALIKIVLVRQSITYATKFPGLEDVRIKIKKMTKTNRQKGI